MRSEDTGKRLVVSDGSVRIDGASIPVGVYLMELAGVVVLSCNRTLVRYSLTELDGVEVVTTEALDERLGCGEF